MSLVYTQTPLKLQFADNPILVKARTDLRGKAFLRIVLQATVGRLTTTMSVSVPDAGEAVFNLSDAARAFFFQQTSHLEADGFAAELSTSHSIEITLQCCESWMEDGMAKVGPSLVFPDLSLPESYTPVVVPGGLTEYERLTFETIDLTQLFADTRPLSRKPVNESVYPGQDYILPLLSVTRVDNGRLQCKDLSDVVLGSSSDYQLKANSSGYAHITVPAVADDTPVKFNYAPYKNRMAIIRPANDQIHFLRFINSFGMLESIAVTSLEGLTFHIEGDEFNLVTEATPRPYSHRCLRKSSPSTVYQLSSGYVNRDWAKWFVQELLTAPKAWILINGKWIPGVIESDEKIEIYNRAKPELCHVDFDFKLSIDGVV